MCPSEISLMLNTSGASVLEIVTHHSVGTTAKNYYKSARIARTPVRRIRTDKLGPQNSHSVSGSIYRENPKILLTAPNCSAFRGRPALFGWLSLTLTRCQAQLFPVSRTIKDGRLAFLAKRTGAAHPADITYIPTGTGFLYLAVVLDAFSRRIVGWAMATSLWTELVLNALNMALQQWRPTSVIHHSDRGSQYTSLALGQRCDKAGVRPSMGSVGDCFDSAMGESVFATLECELLNGRSFKNPAAARSGVFEFIEGWYNPPSPPFRARLSVADSSTRGTIQQTLVTAVQHRLLKRGSSIRAKLLGHLARLPRAQRFYPAVPCTAAGNVSPARRGAVQRKLAAAPLTAISAAVSKLVT